MRQAVPAATLLLLLACGAARSQSTACAVRLRAAASGTSAKSAAPAELLAALPSPPLDLRPLLAGGPGTTGAGAAGAGGPGRRHPLAAWQVLRFATASACDAAVAILRTHPAVEFVEPIRLLYLDGPPPQEPGSRPGADPRLRASRASNPALARSDLPPRAGLSQEIPWNVERVGAPAAIAAVEPDSSILVAVIDTGVDLSHPDLVGRLWRNDDPPGNAFAGDDANDQNGDGIVELWEMEDDDDNGYVDDEYGYDFTDAPGRGGIGDALDRDPDPSDEDGHGTHVSGIIAADGGLRGVAPFVRLMPLRAAFSRVFASAALETDDAAAGIVYAVDNGANILNLSWGDTEESRLVQEAIAYAAERGVLIVAAAGNAANAAPFWPSADPHVIGVAASNRTGGRAGFSSYGPSVELAAPGEELPFPGPGIRSLLPLSLQPDGVGERRGTSMAAPHVAGAAAIVLSRADRPDARRARALLVAGARRTGTADWSPDLGHGELDVLSAVRATDDLVVAVIGPPAPYRSGRLTLVGTVLSGADLRRSLRVRHASTGMQVELVSGAMGQVVADTLVDADFAGMPAGEWEYVLAVETADRRRRERHGAFQVDDTSPQVDTLVAASAWRGSEPRWLLSLRCDDPVRTEVRDAASGVTVLADAGYSRLVQIESEVTSALGATWSVALENAAGLASVDTVAAPAALSQWPEADLDRLSLSFFLPEPFAGRAPSGTPILWGRASAENDTMQAWGIADDRFLRLFDTGVVGRPLASGDANGDGIDDLLFARPGPVGTSGVQWLLSRGSGFPDSLGALLNAGAALGLFQLDDDPAREALFARDDLLFVYDDVAAGPPALVQTLANPSRQGFNAWGVDAAVGDLDGDGRIEIVCGDAEGFVTVFERTAAGYVVERTLDTQGTYAYDLTALPDGFVVGRQRTADVGGDGYPTAVYDFLVYQLTPSAATLVARYPFLAPENSLRTGSTAVRSPAGESWLFLARGKELYALRGVGPLREQAFHLTTGVGDPPIAADFDADGRLEVVLRTNDLGSLLRIRETPGPHSLRAESRGTRIALTWVPGAGAVSRVWRHGAVLGETSASTWVDSTVTPRVDYVYQIEAVVAGAGRGLSNAVTARAQPRPRLLGVLAATAGSLRLACSNPVHPAALAPQRFVVQGPDGPRRVLQVTAAEAGRALDLVLDAPLPCGAFAVEADSLRDDQWGLLDPPLSRLQGERPCTAAPFFVVRVALGRDARGIEVEFSREPGAAVQDVATWRLEWNGAPLGIVRVDRVSAARYLLVPAPGVEFLARGVPYLVRVDTGLRAVDGTALEAPEAVYRVDVEGAGAADVFAVPNPARTTDAEVVFAEAASDTRIRIYNLEGELVRELRNAVGGGLHWDLRGRDGARVTSGVYLYVASDARGTSRGRVAVAR